MNPAEEILAKIQEGTITKETRRSFCTVIGRDPHEIATELCGKLLKWHMSAIASFVGLILICVPTKPGFWVTTALIGLVVLSLGLSRYLIHRSETYICLTNILEAIHRLGQVKGLRCVMTTTQVREAIGPHMP